MASVLFRNAQIITPSCIVPGDVAIAGSNIAAVCAPGKYTGNANRIIDAHGLFLSPGFIDIHTHGGGGADFMDGSTAAIYQACTTHLRHGTTTIVPTTLTSTKQSLLDFIKLFNTIDLCHPDCPEILGLHLEGPYFSMEQRGAQDPRFLRNPDPEEYAAVLALTDRIVRWSFAIELDGAAEFLRVLREHRIVSSVAHSDATCSQVLDAYGNGVRALTHFYSGMSGVRRVNAHRVAGVIEAGYLIDGMYVEVIADGKHLPAELLRLIRKVKGPDRICLVTDSMRGAGMPDGPSILGSLDGGVECLIEDGVAIMPDRTAFAGSVATTDRLVRVMHTLGEVPLWEAVGMATVNPARLMGIDNRKGSIAVGKDADLLIFDDNIHISLVMARGEIVFE